MLKKCFMKLSCGQTSTIHAQCSGRPINVADLETIEELLDMLLADRTLKVSEITEAIGISHGTVVSILIDHL